MVMGCSYFFQVTPRRLGGTPARSVGLFFPDGRLSPVEAFHTADRSGAVLKMVFMRSRQLSLSPSPTTTGDLRATISGTVGQLPHGAIFDNAVTQFPRVSRQRILICERSNGLGFAGIRPGP